MLLWITSTIFHYFLNVCSDIVQSLDFSKYVEAVEVVCLPQSASLLLLTGQRNILGSTQPIRANTEMYAALHILGFKAACAIIPLLLLACHHI